MKINITENSEHNKKIESIYSDRDWKVNQNTYEQITHEGCNNSYIKLLDFSVKENNTYKVSFNVYENSGSITLEVGDKEEVVYGTGYKELTILTEESGDVKIHAVGKVTIGKVDIQTIVETGEDTFESKYERNVVYNEDENTWVSFRSIRPESGVSLFTELITSKDGQLYIHNNRDSRNTFYGNKYDTYIKFPISSAGVKTYQSIAIHSNKVMATTEDGITTQLGHVSDLVTEDFTNREGISYANFLRDKLTDIISGDRLKGRYVVVELEDKCDKKLHLFKVVVKSAVSTPNE